MTKEKLAINGGSPVRKSPLPPMHPGATFIGEAEQKAVKRVLESQSLFRYYGPNFLNITSMFERSLSSYLGVKHVLGVNSGTSALHCALVGAGIGPGDEVIIPTYTWVSCPSAVVATGARPVLANIDKSLTLDPKDVEDKISERTKAIMTVHIRGVGCDLDPFIKIAHKYGLTIIEDTAQAAGGTYHGRKLGSIGDVGIYSFQLNKILSAGEGGAVATNDSIIYERATMFHDTGAPYRMKTSNTEFIPGVNYRMTEITAAIMHEQLKKIDEIISTMRKNKGKIKDAISDIEGIEFRHLPDPEGDTAVCLVFYLPTAEKAREFQRALHAENIYVSSGEYPPVIYDPENFDGHVFIQWKHIFKNIDKVLNKYSQTLDILSRAVHLDISPLFSDEDIDSVIEGVHKVASAIL